jgi:hypothetical protein
MSEVRLIESLATTEALADVFSDRSILRAMLDFEVALARVLSRATPRTPLRKPQTWMHSTRPSSLAKHSALERRPFRW